jgi:nucleoid-associated protein YgaU
MDKKRYCNLAFIFALGAAMSLAGCSSSEVSDSNEVTADELPVVDAETDQLPDQIDGASPDAQLAQGDLPMDGTADGLAPEASVDVPTTTADATLDPTATSDSLAMSEPSTGPSVDAPPVMNETAPVATATSGGAGGEVYEVQGGDTLMKIAFKVYGDVYQWRKVLDDNSDRISDPGRLVKGTQLKVDNAPNEDYYNGYERYLIKSGDTLGYISEDVYGTKTKWKQLWQMNDGLVKDPNRIYAGFFLRYTISDQERQDAERMKSMRSAPLAGSEEPAAERNPSAVAPAAVQEAKAPTAEPAPVQN